LQKKKVLAVSHTAIKTQEVYANGIREVGINDKKAALNGLDHLKDQFNQLVDNARKSMEGTLLEGMADTITKVGEQMETVHQSEKRMTENRADGKRLLYFYLFSIIN
jgi:hypothetical protein